MGWLSLLWHTLRTGRVTTAYPGEPPSLSPRARGRLTVNFSCCTFCGDCRAACPSGVIHVEPERSLELFLGGCVYCGDCVPACGQHAISFTGDIELAARSPEDLWIVGRVEGTTA